MANTYTQLYVHHVFAVLRRESVISEQHREELEKYICGIISNQKCKLITIYRNPDHIHILIGLHPTARLSDLVRDIKANSSKFINERGWIRGRFNWQDGYGAFTYGRSRIDRIVRYIREQPMHHKTKSFKDEYLSTLKKFGVEYDEQYVFD